MAQAGSESGPEAPAMIARSAASGGGAIASPLDAVRSHRRGGLFAQHSRAGLIGGASGLRFAPGLMHLHATRQS